MVFTELVEGVDGGHGHRRRAQGGGADPRAVEVGSARGHQILLLADLQIRRALLGRVLRVVALDAHETGRDQARDQLVSAREPGMGEDGHAARSPDEPDRVLWRELLPGDMPRPAGGEVLVEGLAHRLDVAARHHHLRHVRASRRALLHEREDLVGVERHAQAGHPLGHPVHALPPLPPLLAAELLEPRRLPVHEIAEDVDLRALHVAVDLDAGEKLEGTPALCFLEGLGQPFRGVVIGDGEDADAAAGRLDHEVAGRVRPVRGGRVGVQVHAPRHDEVAPSAGRRRRRDRQEASARPRPSRPWARAVIHAR